MEDPSAAALISAFTDFKAAAIISCIRSRSGGIRDSWAVDFEANQRLLHAALGAGVSHFTLLSAVCVQKPRLAFQQAKLRFEAELQESGLSYSSVRPSAFFKSLSGQLERVRKGKPFLVFGDGTLTACKPIAEQDVAEFICRTLESDEHQGVKVIGGPGAAITPLQQAELLGQCLGKPVKIRRLPAAVPKYIASLFSVPGRFSDRWRDRSEYARIAHYYATESMLVWDEEAQRYDADATPNFGTLTLEQSYRSQLAGTDRQDIGDHALFDR